MKFPLDFWLFVRYVSFIQCKQVNPARNLPHTIPRSPRRFPPCLKPVQLSIFLLPQVPTPAHLEPQKDENPQNHGEKTLKLQLPFRKRSHIQIGKSKGSLEEAGDDLFSHELAIIEVYHIHVYPSGN